MLQLIDRCVKLPKTAYFDEVTRCVDIVSVVCHVVAATFQTIEQEKFEELLGHVTRM